jgi:hypothetical protein
MPRSKKNKKKAVSSSATRVTRKVASIGKLAPTRKPKSRIAKAKSNATAKIHPVTTKKQGGTLVRRIDSVALRQFISANRFVLFIYFY